MENQEVALIRVEINGRRQILFGALDQQKLEEHNGILRYNGNIILLAAVYKVQAVLPGEEFQHNELVRTLEEVRTNNQDISGIIYTGENSDSYWCEGHEFWKSHWQPYIAA